MCKPGYHGNDCTLPCPAGTWGAECTQQCTCTEQRLCDHETGACLFNCPVGWTGTQCDAPCERGTYGQNCRLECDCTGSDCDKETGECICEAGEGTNFVLT